jgi:hypothetical protein
MYSFRNLELGWIATIADFAEGIKCTGVSGGILLDEKSHLR